LYLLLGEAVKSKKNLTQEWARIGSILKKKGKGTTFSGSKKRIRDMWLYQNTKKRLYHFVWYAHKHKQPFPILQCLLILKDAKEMFDNFDKDIQNAIRDQMWELFSLDNRKKIEAYMANPSNMIEFRIGS